MASRLIRYDAALFRRALADGFRGPVDILLLWLLGLIGVAWLRRQAFALPPGAFWFAALAGPIGYAWQRRVRLRLAGLAEHSPVAIAALDRRERRLYVGLAHLIVTPVLVAAALLLGMGGSPIRAVGLAAAAYGAGVMLAAWLLAPEGRGERRDARAPVAPLGKGRRAVLALILARQTLGVKRAAIRAGLLLSAGFVLTLLAGWWGRTLPEPLGALLPLLPPLALLLLAARLDAALLGFLPAAGYGPAFIALAVAALPAASLLATSLAMLMSGAGPGLLILSVLMHLLFIVTGISRAWLYPGRTRRSVNLQLQLEGTGLVAVAVLLPPLAAAALLWRLWHFHRHCRTRRWLAA